MRFKLERLVGSTGDAVEVGHAAEVFVKLVFFEEFMSSIHTPTFSPWLVSSIFEEFFVQNAAAEVDLHICRRQAPAGHYTDSQRRGTTAPS